MPDQSHYFRLCCKGLELLFQKSVIGHRLWCLQLFIRFSQLFIGTLILGSYLNWIGQKGRLQFIGSLRHYFTLAWGWGERKMVKGIHRHSGTCMSRSSRSGPSSTGSQGSCWSPAAGKAPREECAKKFTADISSWPGLLFLWDRHKCSTRHKGNIYFQKKFLISHGGDINK